MMLLRSISLVLCFFPYVITARSIQSLHNSLHLLDPVDPTHFSKRERTPLERGKDLYERLSSRDCAYPAIPQPRKSLKGIEETGWERSTVQAASGNDLASGALEQLVPKDTILLRTDFTRYARKGKYELLAAPQQGVLVSQLAKSDEPAGDYRWSDVAALFWKDMCENLNISRRNSLRYVVRPTIINKVMTGILDEICAGQSPCWKNVDPSSDLQAFYTLLGSPNANGVAWMLLQNYDILGYLTIKSILIIVTGRGEYKDYSMILMLAPNTITPNPPLAAPQSRGRTRVDRIAQGGASHSPVEGIRRSAPKL